MPPRTLASLAHALSAAPDLDVAIVALGESLDEVDRGARLAILTFDARKEMIRDILRPAGARIERSRSDTTFDHLPGRLRMHISAGGQFADFGERSDEYARLLGVAQVHEEGLLGMRGYHADGALSVLLAVFEPKRFFGTRVMERFAPYAALFELAVARFAEREARNEAVKTLEDVTQRVHGEYVRKLNELERKLAHALVVPALGTPAAQPDQLLSLERAAAAAQEEARRARSRNEALEQQATAAVSQLEQAHVELHRRSEVLRQKTRTLYLVEKVLAADAAATDPRQLADALLAAVGDDMQAQRCSLMLCVPEATELYIAASRGLSPVIGDGARVQLGRGVAGKVAAARQPLLVTDVTQAQTHPLLRDEFFTTGSFISFPLVYHDKLVGVLNLTNRARRGVFVEEDIERVRLLALVVSLVASHARLPERLLESAGVR